MASSDLVNYISAGSSDATASAVRVVEVFFAATTDIAVGDFVALDTSQTGADRVRYIVPADADSAATQQAIGVALDAVDVSDDADLRCRVVVRGYVEGANVSTSTTLGALLTAGSTAGEAALYDADATDANYLPIAQALEADTAGVADVWVFGLGR